MQTVYRAEGASHEERFTITVPRWIGNKERLKIVNNFLAARLKVKIDEAIEKSSVRKRDKAINEAIEKSSSKLIMVQRSDRYEHLTYCEHCGRF